MGRVVFPSLASINNGNEERSVSPVYPGLVVDYEFIHAHVTGKESGGLIMILDVPFSFCADTLLLPVDLYYIVKE